ncbi:hypothetical protein UFOVP351_21 [uncultured Caudovirales phage]|uniref:Uncharacterized protein n=1 Tax=uncultured Caudovirales phage TaxID=2100421 RepID=A0A6J5LXA3_9CAUD|nr:hypothetical protein UFOVP351_21 [uncultured Caudovirales phage]
MKNNLDIRVIERNRIVGHVRNTARHILVTAMADPEMNLERAEVICTVLEDVADSIEGSEHWSQVN